MLHPIDSPLVLKLNPLYKLENSPENNDSIFFITDTISGQKIETDLNGKLLIERMPLTCSQLIESFRVGIPFVSSDMIQMYITLFKAAGIIIPSEDDQSNEINEKSTVEQLKQPCISVVIVTFNGERFIRKNLESLYKQSLLPGEIIIIDNASGDSTLEIVSKEFPQVKFLRNEKNYHYAKAVNIGVEEAMGDLVLILNQDIVLEEKCIEMLFKRYTREREKLSIAGVIPQMRFNKMRNFINGIGNFLTEKNWGSDNYFCAVDFGQFETIDYASSACFGAIMVTKMGWKDIGPLDETYKSFYEDVDWSMRAHLMKKKILAAPAAIVYHEFGGSYPSGLKLKLVAKNRMRFVFKHLRGKIFTRFFFKYLKQDIKNGLAFLRDKSFRNVYYYKMAYLRLMIELPGLMFYRLKHKHSEKEIGEFFTKGAPYVALANRQGNPVINASVIRSYYNFTLIEDFHFPTEPILYIN